MECKVFVSSMGWGHMIRQLTILRELSSLFPNLKITIQAKHNFHFINFFIKNYNFVKDDNLIKYFYNKNGSIDSKKTKNYYFDYLIKSRNWIDKNLNDKNYDFFISDISPEAIKVASELKKPVFGVCHFTWDWFFKQFLPVMVDPKIIKIWEKYQKLSSKFFFPPLTPLAILEKYNNHYQVPFISTNLKKPSSQLRKKNKYNILLMDSGDKLIRNEIKKILINNKNKKSINFFHPESFGNYNNTVSIKKNELLTDYIKIVDLVIARPGFNTITSVIKEKKPSIYFLSKDNPETNWNIHQLHSFGITHSMTTSQLINNFSEIIKDKLKYENKKKMKKTIETNFKFGGQKIISKLIKNYLK